MRTKNLWKALLGAVATLLLAVLLSGGIMMQTASAAKGGGVFADYGSEGRVKYEEPVDITLKTDTQYSSTRMYYTQNVDTSEFKMSFTLNSFNVDGGLRISFLSSKDDFPMQGYGDGFGVYLWDETAWGHNRNSSLRLDFYSYGKNPAIETCADQKAMRNPLENVETGNTFNLHVWNFDNDNLAIQITRNSGSTESVDMIIGTYSKSNFPFGFDYKNCTLFLSPMIDDNRPHSYEQDVRLTIHNVLQNNVPMTGEFADVLENGRVTVQKGEPQTTLTVTDGQPSLTRMYYTQRVSVTDFTAEFQIDQFNTDGGLRISFLKTTDDYPMEGFGDGFGIYMYEGKGWNPESDEKTTLGYRAGIYGKTGGSKISDVQWMRVTEGNIVENQKFILHVESNGENLVVTVTRENASKENQTVSFEVAKSDLPEGFDYTDCVVIVTPEINTSEGFEHSYAKDIKLSHLNIDWRRETVSVTATTDGYGTVTIDPNVSEIERGSTVTFTIQPDEGYLFESATLNGEEVSLTGYTFETTATKDLVFEVTFKTVPTSSITIQTDGHGTVTSNPAFTTVEQNSTVVFTVAPDKFYEVDTVLLNGQEVMLEADGTYTAIAVEDLVFNVTFTKLAVATVRVTAGEGGSVLTDPNEDEVLLGTEVTFTVHTSVINKIAYKVEQAFLNGVPVPLTNGKFVTLANVDLEFEVVFVKYAVDPNSPFVDFGFNPNRTDVTVSENGSMTVCMTTKDNSDTLTRIYSKNAIKLDLFTMKFTLDALNVNGGLKIAFVSTDDDYPLDRYGNGFALWLYDDTAAGNDAFTSLRAVITAHSRTADAVQLHEAVFTSEEGYLGAEVVITVTYADGVIKFSLQVGETDVFEETAIEEDALSSTFYTSECYLMVGPSAHDSSAEKADAVITIVELNMSILSGGDIGSDVEYSVTYVYDGKILKQDYVEAGNAFPNYTPAAKEGYTFEGWYIDEACTEKYDFSIEAVRDIILYALFSKNDVPAEKGCGSAVESTFGIVFGTLAIAAAAATVTICRKKNNG